MARPQLPPLESVVGDLFADRTRVRTLVAGAAALLAAGIDPRIWAPQLTTVQAAVRAQPGLDSLIMLNGLAAAIVFPVALASIALAFNGIARATAIGIGYAAFGIGQAVMPILLEVVPG